VHVSRLASVSGVKEQPIRSVPKDRRLSRTPLSSFR
jgi:hypothetical protein